MSPITRRRLLGGFGCCCASLALAACTARRPDPPVAPGYRPASATDEGGLWSVMDRAEREIRRSRHLIRDPEVNAYVHDLACRLAGDHCRDLRVYLLRAPYFNATMAPNGMMQVWSGLLLRARNEAQLAAVLGHEIGHYLQRHSIENWRSTRDTMDVMTFLTIGMAVAGTPGALIDLANQLAVAGIFAFRRDQEREADDVGIRLMAKAGYAPIEASRVWEQVIAEEAADERPQGGSLFFATHPDPAERVGTLRRRSAGLAAPGQTDGREAYRRRMRALRRMLFADELRLRQFPRTLVLLDRLSAELAPDGDILFFYGELYRLRDEKGDAARARKAYERSVATGDFPPEALRGLRLVLRQGGERRRADEVLRRYLKLAPEAPDRALVQSYITGA